MKDIIKQVFKERDINFDSGRANCVDDVFSAVVDAIEEIVKRYNLSEKYKVGDRVYFEGKATTVVKILDGGNLLIANPDYRIGSPDNPYLQIEVLIYKKETI